MSGRIPTDNDVSVSEVVSRLRESLGERVIIDADRLAETQADKSGQVSAAPPLCLVEASSTEDVAEVLRIANDTKTPVVTRGGGSGLAGGAIATTGEIVLSLAKMDRIIEISRDDRWAVVEAGVVNQDLNNAAKEQGLWFAPDPASRHWSTVGGNIATNAGGLLCVKYGVTREAVLDLTVVLAGGEVLTLGHRTVKGVTGYDLSSLMVGSEGTLGVITEARVALKPVDPNPVWTLSGTARDIDIATQAVQETISRGRQPAILELMDAPSVGHVANYLGRTDIGTGAARLIGQTDGAAAEDEAQEIAEIWRGCGLEVEVGEDRDDLINFRRSMHPAMEAVGTVLIEDIAVPRSQLGAMFAAIREIEKEFDVEIPTVAHAGDGNLHPNFIYSGAEVPPHIWAAAEALFHRAIALGGTLTGEHGVGLLKRQWMMDEIGQPLWDLQWQIKKLFDPHGILNPGKVFDPQSVNSSPRS
jgi:glycolate oxidase